jgi:hypothetical protein
MQLMLSDPNHVNINLAVSQIPKHLVGKQDERNDSDCSLLNSCCSAFHSSIVKVPPEANIVANGSSILRQTYQEQ